MAFLCQFVKEDGGALSHSVAVKALEAFHSLGTAAEETHHCSVARAGAAVAAPCVHNKPHLGRGVTNPAGTKQYVKIRDGMVLP